MKRREAATWLESQTGASIPADYDCDFRAALADGVLLCKIANVLYPDSIKVCGQHGGMNRQHEPHAIVLRL